MYLIEWMNKWSMYGIHKTNLLLLWCWFWTRSRWHSWFYKTNDVIETNCNLVELQKFPLRFSCHNKVNTCTFMIKSYYTWLDDVTCKLVEYPVIHACWGDKYQDQTDKISILSCNIRCSFSSHKKKIKENTFTHEKKKRNNNKEHNKRWK